MTDTASQLIYARNLRGLDETRQQHARAVALRREVRVIRGAYFDGAAWEQYDPRERYVLKVRAVAETRRNRPVISHWSAAAVHRLPVIGDWPASVHVTQGTLTGTRSRNGVARHSLSLDDADVVEVDGMLVTSVARTVLDMAVLAPLMDAVTIADFALHLDRFGRYPPLATRDELQRLWQQRLPFRGHARSLEVIEFAETRADTPIESVSRVNMRVIGCPRPLLQSSFSDAEGFIGETDFSWPQYGIVGEADGDRKYLDERFRRGRSAEQVFLDEKVREDRLRALPQKVARWPWSVAVHPDALRRRLSGVGLPMGVGWR